MYVPYYDNPFHPTLAYLKRCIERYFEIVDHVKLFSLSGGEPMLCEDLLEIVDEIHKYLTDLTDLKLLPTEQLSLLKSSLKA